MTGASKASPVLITGATGFIGRTVTRRLTADGIPVRAGWRGSTLPPSLRTMPGISPVRCDLDAPEELEAACQGVDAVIHAAYGDPARLGAQCRHLLAAAEAAGVTRIILLSSIAVYGAATGLCDERRALDAPADAYGEGKRACEALIREWVDAGSARRSVAFRPGIVYGGASPLWTRGMIARLRAGGVGDFGEAGSGRAPLVHVDDVARAIALALGHRWRDDQPRALTLNLVHPRDVSWNAYFSALSRRAGLGSPRQISPARLRARQALRIPAKVMARLGLPVLAAAAATPGAGEMALFCRQATYPAEAALHAIGWEPAIDLEEGLRHTGGQETSPSP